MSFTSRPAFPLSTGNPRIRWPDARASIEAWTANAGATNIRPPVDLDASAPVWPVAAADAIVAINMIHISPWSATTGLLEGAGRILPPGGILFAYGPFRRADHPFAPSNAAFDADLRLRDPEWGIRDVAEVEAAATHGGLALDEIIGMPANNLSLVFRKK